MPPQTPEEGLELEQLLASIQEGDVEQNQQTVQVLRDKGWLMDGTLVNADLISADLSGADLRDANLMNAYMRGVDLRGANLSRANLSHTNMNGVNLSGADLTGTNLSGAELISAYLSAHLWGADLSGVDLRGGDLVGADLRDADLRGADLQGADLRGADLRGADLSGALLWGANLTHARCAYTTFGDVDLSVVVGLETIYHDGPSTVGIDTLYLSRGKVQAAFLRGCGVPETFAELSRKILSQSGDYFACYISYSSADAVFARQLHDALQTQGVRCWLDEKQAIKGDVFRKAITQGSRVYDKVVLVCSATAFTESRWIEEEIENATSKEAQLCKIRDRVIQRMEASGKAVTVASEPSAIIPITVDHYLFDEYDGYYAAQIIKRRVISFGGWDDENSDDVMKQGVAEIIKALKVAGGKLQRVGKNQE